MILLASKVMALLSASTLPLTTLLSPPMTWAASVARSEILLKVAALMGVALAALALAAALLIISLISVCDSSATRGAVGGVVTLAVTAMILPASAWATLMVITFASRLVWVPAAPLIRPALFSMIAVTWAMAPFMATAAFCWASVNVALVAAAV